AGVTLNVHPRIADMLLKEEEAVTNELEQEVGKQLTINTSKDLHIEKYSISWDD
ncbi:MAG TPA: ribonuclease, partial [Desulfobacterales bacterium]|nr:ribonuclease [Desulfobacterales bacterium]